MTLQVDFEVQGDLLLVIVCVPHRWMRHWVLRNKCLMQLQSIR
jgi:hypothetical protein